MAATFWLARVKAIQNPAYRPTGDFIFVLMHVELAYL
jgi:hypothetical protein